MSVSAPCELCSHGEAEHTCMRCGNLVCDDCFDTARDLCEKCLGEVGEGPARIPDGEEMPDGVDTYQF